MFLWMDGVEFMKCTGMKPGSSSRYGLEKKLEYWIWGFSQQLGDLPLAATEGLAWICDNITCNMICANYSQSGTNWLKMLMDS